MATNTTATTQNHNGTGSQNNFAISFSFLENTEVKVKVGGVLKTLGTHYNIVGSQVQFTSGNTPPSGTANIVFTRDTNISTKKVDFEDGSVLTETDLDNNSDQILFAQQEFTNDYVKRDGSQTVTGDLVFEGATDDGNETTLAITDPTDDRTITVPDRSGTIITSGDTGTVTNTILAGNSVDSSKIIDGSIVNADVNASANISGSKLQGASSSNAGSMSANDKTKLDAIESGATADQTNDEIRDAVEAASNSNTFTDADHTKLNNIEDNATRDQTSSDIKTLLASDPLTAAHLDANSVDSSELVDGSVDHSHLSNDCVDGDNIQDDSIDNEHIAANAVRVNEIKDGEITSAKLNASAVITSSEQGSATTNDTSFLTSAAADARFFNISSGDTIKDGQSFPDNDTTIATTAAINDRIIDIVNDVGGFDIVESEQHFPNSNPQGQAGSAAVLSIKAASAQLPHPSDTNISSLSGTTLTIKNGNLADNADITITGVTATIPSGFGFIVESTTTLHTYAFHRLVPNATEVTTVAGKAVEIGRLGTADAVADMAILGTTDVVADMNTLATTDIVADMNTLATTDVVNDMNTLAVTSVINDMDTVATNVTNVNNVGNNITNVNNLTNSTGANQTFTVTVQNVSGNKYFIDGVQTPVLKLARGKTYTFNLADSSNSGHPLAFRDSSDSSYTTGVTTSGTAGSSGATVVIVVAANAPNTLKYYCTSHGNSMGNTINVIDDNVGAVAGALTNVNNVGGSITNVNTVATNIDNVNDFFDKYRVGANNPTSSLDVGDLFFNTTSGSLKVYTGSAWVDGVTATGSFASVTGNTFTGDNKYNDGVKLLVGTGSDLEIFHHQTDGSFINDAGTSTLKLQVGGSTKLEIQSGGVGITGNIAVSGTVDGRDVATDGTKLDGIETNATADQTVSEIKTLIASSPLDASHLAADSVTSSELAANSVDSSELVDGSVDHSHLSNDCVDGDNIQDDSINSEHYVNASIDHAHLSNDCVDGDNIADDSINSEHYVNGSIDTAHIADDAVTTDKIANNAITTAQINNGEVTNAKLAANAVTADKINDGEISTAKIADTAVTLAKLEHGTSSNNGKFLRANNGADPTFETVNTDLVSDTSPQLGGLLDGNGQTANFTANNTALGIPIGTTANQPTASSYKGYIRYDDTLDVVTYSDGSSWKKISSVVPTLTSVTGNIFVSSATTLTLAGTGFLSANLVINFTQSSDSIDTDVTVTPSSDTAASVAVPAAVYNNVTASNVVTITVTNSDGGSVSTTKTASALPTGGTITTSGGFRIHTFTSSGTFVNTIANNSVEYLVIAGGASGGNSENFSGTGSSGGGAGGYRSSVSGQSSGGGASAESALTLSAASYSVTIGAGGASSTGHGAGNNGNNSVFGSITSLAGGRGGGGSSGADNGGSGGGQGYSGGIGTGTSGQGHNGGTFSDPEGAGGGGAGAVGVNGGGAGGAGGIGVSSNITGSAVMRGAGGGGSGGSVTNGGNGGTGGGGNGTSTSGTSAGSGSANTGSGGGGTGPADGGTSGAGGSGIVIVRYAV